MYTGHGFANWGMGDIDVILVDGTYHLFHLALPNHSARFKKQFARSF
jgi:beta-fructofuranosidase